MSRRIAVLRDFREEHWPSMDLVADMLLDAWPKDSRSAVVSDVCPPYRARFTRIPGLGAMRAAVTLDRAINRFHLLPKHVRGLRSDFDFFHIADHSYAHLVNELPAERAGVYCHDIDAFRCLLDPKAEHRSWWFRKLTQRILEGMRKAALVFHSTHAMGRRLQDLDLVEASRLRYAPFGVSPEFAQISETSGELSAKLVSLRGVRYLLHVGSCIPRKRIDVLLNVFARVREAVPELRLVKVGDAWTAGQERFIDSLRLRPFLIHLGKVSREELAAVYQHAAATLVPSDAEGFGLPVLEALACGGPVVGTDLPTLREAGGSVASYAPVADVEAWTAAVSLALSASSTPRERESRREWSRRFSWTNHARVIAEAYRNLA